MLRECIGVLAEGAHGDAPLFVDATLGAGGHTEGILRSFPSCRVIAFDQDAQARAIASERLAEYSERLRVIPANFRELASALESECGKVDGVLFDFGVSLMQLSTPERGFSFGDDGPLDMRMDQDSGDPSAYDILDELDVRDMTKLFAEYGEEHYAKMIASGIVRAREEGALPSTTSGLVALIREILPQPIQRKMGTHPARRVFQALRIAVNSELDVIHEGLEGAIEAAADGCIIAAISYHSLEDRIVKQTFRRWYGDGRGRIVIKRPITPAESEVEENKSARSAKLRAFAVIKDTSGKGV